MKGGLHSVETVGDRYVDAATSMDFPNIFKAGSVVMPPMSFRYCGATGPLTDNTDFRKEFGDEACQDRVAECLRKEIAKCKP